MVPAAGEWEYVKDEILMRARTVPAEGLEPPTPTLGRWRSIH